MVAGDAVIHTEALRKCYPDGVEAVRGVDLGVHSGQTFGILGPKGAGKSTIISMLCTLCRPTGGRARVAGIDVVSAPDEVRRRIGIVFQDATVDAELTAVEHMLLHAALYTMPRRGLAERISFLLELVGLADRGRDVVRTFSAGMRRRLEIARGLLHAPTVLFLDEPTIGLDPETRTHIWEHLREIRREQGITLFLTTHYLDEAEYCDRIAIIDEGQIVVEGSPSGLKSGIDGDRIVIRTDDDTFARTEIRSKFGLSALPVEGGLRIVVPDGASFVPRLCGGLVTRVQTVNLTRPSLDDVFVRYTGRRIRDKDGAPPC